MPPIQAAKTELSWFVDEGIPKKVISRISIKQGDVIPRRCMVGECLSGCTFFCLDEADPLGALDRKCHFLFRDIEGW